jgi:hypothetical protein
MSACGARERNSSEMWAMIRWIYPGESHLSPSVDLGSPCLEQGVSAEVGEENWRMNKTTSITMQLPGDTYTSTARTRVIRYAQVSLREGSNAVTVLSDKTSLQLVQRPVFTVVAPVFNEEQTLPHFY